MFGTFKMILIGCLLLYLIGGILLYVFQDNLIFLPEELPADYAYTFDADFEEHFIKVKDGSSLNALHFKRSDSKGLIVYFHGNAGNLARWGEVVLPFVKEGYEVLIYDYRGYGKSTGKRNRQKLLNDADAVYALAKQIETEDRIIVLGRSLGSAFASYVGGKNNPEMIILETPFYHLKDVAEKVAPIYPTGWLLHYRFRNHRWLKNARAPVYIFHGTDDEVVPYASGEKLFKSINANQVQLITIEGGRHNDLSAFSVYWEEMKKVLKDE